MVVPPEPSLISVSVSGSGSGAVAAAAAGGGSRDEGEVSSPLRVPPPGANEINAFAECIASAYRLEQGPETLSADFDHCNASALRCICSLENVQPLVI